MPSVNKQPRINSEFEYTPSDDTTVNVVNKGLADTMDKVKKSGEYIYFCTGNMIYRYNEKTGNITSLCSDPLCFHNTGSCPFSGILQANVFYIYDNEVFYTQSYSYYNEDDEWRVGSREVMYNFEKQSLSVMRKLEEGFMYKSELYYKNYRYFISTLYNQDTKEYKCQLCRQNLNTFEINVLRESDDTVYRFNSIIDDRIYMYSESDFLYFSNDNFDSEIIVKEKMPYDFSNDGKYFFSTDPNSEKSLFRMKIDGNDYKSLNIKNVHFFYLTDNYIYYTLDKMVTVGIDKDGNDVQSFDSDIYRCNHDGSDNQLIWSSPENMSNYTLDCFVVSGNYLYAPYMYYDVNVSPQYYSINSKMCEALRINLTTGDIYYIGG